jgi:hypothetical protein
MHAVEACGVPRAGERPIKGRAHVVGARPQRMAQRKERKDASHKDCTKPVYAAHLLRVANSRWR